MKDTLGVLLAGGAGERLYPLTRDRAKPAVTFGGIYRIIDITLSNCINSDLRHVYILTQYKALSLNRHIREGWNIVAREMGEFIEILPPMKRVSENWYMGTADAVYQNIYSIGSEQPKHVLILSGDHIYKMDYGRMLAAHVESRADLTIACIEVPIDEAKSFGVMEINEDKRIVAFTEKPENPTPMPGNPDRALASMGVYVFNARFLYEQLVRDSIDNRSSHDFGKDIIPHCMKRYRVCAHSFTESCVGDAGKPQYWRDVGTIDAYWEANMDLTHVTPDLNLYDEDWPIWTWQEQLPPAKFVFDSDSRRGFAVDSLVAGGSVISGAEVRRSMLFSRTWVHSYAKVSDSVILPEVDIGRGAVLHRCVVDKRCRIPDGLQIGVNPDEDRKRFHVSAGGITLVTPDMLGQHVHFIR